MQRLLSRALGRKPHGPSLTAEGVCFFRALETKRAQARRRLADPYAAYFLRKPLRRALDLYQGEALPLFAQASVGLFDDVILRHASMDRLLHKALSAGVERIVLLGAGYDARAWRFREARIPVLELDRREMVDRKAARVAAHPDTFGQTDVHRIAVDFRSADWAQHLLSLPGPSAIVWEGVSMYLDRTAVLNTAALLGRLAPGTQVFLDLWCRRWGFLEMTGGAALALTGEQLRFGLPLEDAPQFFARTGLAVRELIPLDRNRLSRQPPRLGVVALSVPD